MTREEAIYYALCPSRRKERKRMEKCPFCGGSTGLVAVGKFTQLYDWSGNPDGYAFDYAGTLTARCIDCGRRITLSKLEDACEAKMDGRQQK